MSANASGRCCGSQSLHLGALGLELCDGIADIRVETCATGVEMGKDRRAHPWIPEFPDVFGNARNRVVVALTLEELSDLIGHIDQPVRRHGRLRRRQRRS